MPRKKTQKNHLKMNRVEVMKACIKAEALIWQELFNVDCGVQVVKKR